MINNMCVMTNNLRAVVNLLVVLLALSDKLFLTLLNVGGVNNGLALLSWNLSLMLLRNLVALMVYMVLAMRSMGVTSMNLVRIMTNNLGAVVNLGVLFLTMCGDNFLTLLNVGSINNHIIFLMPMLSLPM